MHIHLQAYSDGSSKFLKCVAQPLLQLLLSLLQTYYLSLSTAKGSFPSDKNKDGAASSFCFDLVMAARMSQHLLQEWQHCWGGWVHQYLPGAGSVIGIPIAKAL